MRKLKVAVASGGTVEKIDDVRVITNISSGKLGSIIADKFIEAGHDVTYIAPKHAVFPEGVCSVEIISDANSVMSTMSRIVPESDCVLMPMAVSDFTFKYDGAVKLSSSSADDFIQHMKDSIVPTPKVISHFRAWNPRAVLIGFKFTSGKSAKELLTIAKTLKEKNRLDMVFANDKKDMERSGSHRGILIMDTWDEKCNSKNDIAREIFANSIRMAGARGLK